MLLGQSPTTFPTRVPDASLRDVGVFVQDEWDLTGQLHVVAGARFDSYRVTTEPTPGYNVAPVIAGAVPPIDPATLPNPAGDRISRTAFTGDLGAVYKLNERTSVIAHYGRSYRHPNLEELLFAGPATAGNIAPNIKVEPEKGDNLDLGVKIRSGACRKISYFAHVPRAHSQSSSRPARQLVPPGCQLLQGPDPGCRSGGGRAFRRRRRAIHRVRLGRLHPRPGPRCDKPPHRRTT